MRSLILRLLPWLSLLCVIVPSHGISSHPTPTRRPPSAYPTSVDLLVYGSSSAAVTAAYAAGRHNLSVLFVTPYLHLGGLTTSGLSATDVGNSSTIGGLAALLYRSIGSAYNLSRPLYDFEPHTAEAVFNRWMADVSSHVTVAPQYTLASVQSTATNISQVTFTPWPPYLPSSPADDFSVSATVYIDASYEGDLLAMAGVPFTLGRESRAQYNETLAGVTADPSKGSKAGNQINVVIDPWIVPNDTSSGLIPGVDGEFAGRVGEGDDLVQSNNYRLCITTNVSNQLPFDPPADYDETQYLLLYHRFINESRLTTAGPLFNSNGLPHQKFDWNNGGGVSTDYFHYDLARKYIEAETSQRDTYRTLYEHWTQGLLYFLANDLTLPSAFRQDMQRYGYCADEFIDNGGFPYQLYVREGRRMLGSHIITQHDVDQDGVKIVDGVALGSYKMDTHNGQRVAVYEADTQRWVTKNEGDVQVAPARGPWPISYAGLVPARGSVGNLLVTVCMSASHMGYASARMEVRHMDNCCTDASDRGLLTSPLCVVCLARVYDAGPCGRVGGSASGGVG